MEKRNASQVPRELKPLSVSFSSNFHTISLPSIPYDNQQLIPFMLQWLSYQRNAWVAGDTTTDELFLEAFNHSTISIFFFFVL